MADDLALGNLSPVFGGVAAVLAFLLGATLTSLLILWARARSLESVYALPLIVEAALLIFFGLTGHIFAGARLLGTVMLLCFTMGLQNAMITKLSNSVIRTTHLTGMVTDTGIALGRLVFAVFGRREQHGLPELALNLARDFASLRLLTSLIGLFFMGGVSGALGFRHIGFFFTLPFAAVLLLMAAMPVLADIEQRRSPARAD
jgi:uncharacterized membrane protein YoaK (UPF0700 family)